MLLNIMLIVVIILFVLGLVYSIYRWITAKKVYKFIDEPIQEYLDEWNEANTKAWAKSKRKSPIHSSKSLHYAYNKVSIDYLSIILSELKSMKDGKGIGSNFSDLAFKMLPIFVFIVTLVTTIVWNIYNFSQKKITDVMTDENQKVATAQVISQGISDLSKSTLDIVGIITFLFLTVYVLTAADIFFYDKRSEENQKRISVIEEIMKHRQPVTNRLYTSGYRLKTESDYKDATLLSIPIKVFLNNTLCNQGFIQNNYHDRITVNNSDYSKVSYTFETV